MYLNKSYHKIISAICIIGLTLPLLQINTIYADEITTNDAPIEELADNDFVDLEIEAPVNNQESEEILIDSTIVVDEIPEEETSWEEIFYEETEDVLIIPDSEIVDNENVCDEPVDIISPDNEIIENEIILAESDLLEEATLDSDEDKPDSWDWGGYEENFIYDPDAFDDYYPLGMDGAIESDIYSVADFGADGSDTQSDRAAFQKALNEAREHSGRQVTINVPAGTYYLDSVIYIYSNTNLVLDSNAVIKRSANFCGSMLVNGADDREKGSESSNLGGYTRSKSISVSGGKWDCKTTMDDPTSNNYGTGMYFGHAINVTIKNTTVINNADVHLIEFTGCKNVTVDNVTLGGFSRVNDTPEVAQWKEALQLDYTTKDTSAFFGPYDSTTCDNVVIKNCTINNYPCGIGDHTRMGDYYHTNVQIASCTLSNNSFRAIDLNNFKNFTLSDNTITCKGKPIYTEKSSGTIKNCTINGSIDSAIEIYENSNIAITGNKISNTKLCGIKAVEKSTITATNNTITNCGTYGIFCSTGANSLISFNTISKFTDYGILVYGASASRCTKFNISDNVISTGGKIGISVNYADYTIVSRNKVSGTTSTGIEISSTCTKSEIYGNSGTVKNGDKTSITAKNGFVKRSDGKWMYYINGALAKGFRKINGYWYYFDSKGIMISGCFKYINNYWYYFNTNGTVVMNCFKKINNKYYFFNTNGTVAINCFKKINNKYYFFDTKGIMAAGCFKKISGKYYYFNPNGTMVAGCFKKINNKYYYFNPNGTVAMNCFKKISNNYYYFNTDGTVAMNCFKCISKKYYFFHPNGTMARGWTKINEKYYYFYSDGHMARSEWIGNRYVDSKGVFVKSR